MKLDYAQIGFAGAGIIAGCAVVYHAFAWLMGIVVGVGV